jgi:uncharacterized protein YjdB
MRLARLRQEAVRARRVIALAPIAGALAACGGATESAPPPQAVVGSIVVTLSASRLEIGGSTLATATVLDRGGSPLSGRVVSWSSADQTIATVDAGGRVQALGPGTIAITASADGKQGSAELTVVPAAVASVTVTLADSVIAGSATQATATVRDLNANTLTGRAVAWSSSNVAIATVSPTGIVTGVTEGGPVVITATSESKSGTAPIRVTARPAAASVSILLASDVLIAAATEVARPIVLDAAGDTLAGRSVSWTSTNPAVVSVDSAGHFTAVAAGQADLIAAVEGKVARTTIRVEPRSRFEGDCVFCWVPGNDPRAPQWDPARQGYVPSAGDSREQITIDEAFAVPAGRTVVWDDKIVWIRPHARSNILIAGHLTIHNSLVLWDQTEHQETRFDVRRGGVLRIENSFAFSSNAFWVNWEYEDGATVSLDHYRGDPWTTIHGSVDYTAVNGSTVKLTLLNDVRGSSVTVADAHHVWLELFPAPGTYELSLPKRQQWGDWQLPALWPATAVHIANSYIYARDISLANDVHATITNTPSGFSLGWSVSKASAGFVDCELHDLGNPNDDGGVFYENMTWDLPCNNSSLSVRNSVLQRAWPVAWGNVHLRVFTSNLVDPRNFGGPATLEIYTSSLDHIAAYQGGLVYLENSRIRSDIQVTDPGSAVYAFQVTPRDAVSFQIYQENGGKYIELSTRGPPWK